LTTEVIAARRPSIEERCAEFDRQFPEVYDEIKRLALKDYADGRRHSTMGWLAETARRHLVTPARDAEGFKINHDFRAIWTRRLIAEHPDLSSMFETRRRRAA
jgi:hypothetical protein